MIKILCPYCGGRCEIIHGMDGNPYHPKEDQFVCSVCGRSISLDHTKQMNRGFVHHHIFLNSDESANIDIEDDQVPIDMLNLEHIQLKIRATSQGAGVQREAETKVSILDGTYSLGNEYPFGRRDIDHKPVFSLCDVTIHGNEISIVGETIKMSDLPKTITKKLTAYGYGYVPWEEQITIILSIDGGQEDEI